MNWKAIEKAIRRYAKDHEIETYYDQPHGDMVANVDRTVNISELARAIDKAITVKVD